MALVKIILFHIILTGFSSLFFEPVPQEKEGPATKAVVISVDASINPATSEYISSGIELAREKNAECLIIKLNTPGGLLKSTRVIVSDILDSDIPVAVFVYPGDRRRHRPVFS